MNPKSSLPIKKGECILTEKPFVFVLKSKYRTERCDFCLSTARVLKCASCRYVYYCNRACQKEAWKLHKTECKLLESIYPRVVPDAARILLRIILKLRNNGDSEKGYYTNTSFRKFKDLMTHYKQIKKDKHRMEHFESITYILQDMMGNNFLPNTVELLGYYGRLVINGFNILDGEMSSVATGIYLGVSVTDHDCKPNAVATFEGTTLYLRALEDMPKIDWSKICISYIDIINTSEDRRNDLKQNYYFLCCCSKCIDPKETIEMLLAACPNTYCTAGVNLLNENIKKCDTCLSTVTQEYVKEYFDVLELTKMHLYNMKDVAYLDVCKICLKKQTNLFHPLNIWHVKTLDLAFESAIEIGKWNEAITYGNELLNGFRKYSGDFNPLLGLLYMKLGKIQLFIEEFSEAKKNLKEAETILKITHGHQHSLYKYELMPLLLQINVNQFN